MMLDDLYHRAWQTPHNVNEHVPVLKLMAAECAAVVEFGTDAAVSTTALLAGQPGKLTTIDIAPCPAAEKLRPFAGRTTFEIVQADTLTTEIEPCDLLFIDSKHTFAQLAHELEYHGVKARRWIVLHDTVAFGMTGEDGGRGLTAALNQFLFSHPEWSVLVEWRNNNGLTVLKRILPNRQT